MKRILLIFLGICYLCVGCQKQEEQSQVQGLERNFIQKKTYSIDQFPYGKEALEAFVKSLNYMDTSTQSRAGVPLAQGLVKESLSLGTRVAENRNEYGVTYSVGLVDNALQDNRFKNLIIREMATGQAAFVVTYYPTEKYLEALREGFEDMPFEGEIEIENIYYENEQIDENAISQICFTIEVDIPCTAGGNHMPGEHCSGSPSQQPRTVQKETCYVLGRSTGGRVYKKQKKENLHLYDKNYVPRPIVSSGEGLADSNKYYPNFQGIKYFCNEKGYCKELEPITIEAINDALRYPFDDLLSPEQAKVIRRFGLQKNLHRFLSQRENSKQAFMFAQEAIEVLSQEKGFVNFDDGIINKIKNEKGKQIVNQLKSSTDLKKISKELKTASGSLNLSEMIIDLFDRSTHTDLIFQEDVLEKSNGSTFNTTITLDTYYMQTATKLAIARTVIHEMIHAYLKMRCNREKYKEFGSEYIGGLLTAYANKNCENCNENEIHHEYMGQYVDAMAASLQEWDKKYGTRTDLGWEYYRAMAFGGLFQVDQTGVIIQETKAFKELVPDRTEREKIAEICFNEQKANHHAKSLNYN